ncbi:uncharacterized protein KZ484_011508 [Pholidichthys leucotaenia]
MLCFVSSLRPSGREDVKNSDGPSLRENHVNLSVCFLNDSNVNLVSPEDESLRWDEADLPNLTERDREEAAETDGDLQSKRWRNIAAKEIVEKILSSKHGGGTIMNEYDRTKNLTDAARRKMINILAADMTDKYGTCPPKDVRVMYAQGIVALFPYLKDPFSKNGYEHFYDPDTGSGYLAWRLKTIQRKAPEHRDKSLTFCPSSVIRDDSVIPDLPDCDREDIQSKRQCRHDITAKVMVENILLSKHGGRTIMNEYNNSKNLTDATRRKMINMLAADMTDKYGTSPPKNVRVMYAQGIVALFPHLGDPRSKNGYEHFYDPDTGSGYLAWRLKTIQRKTSECRGVSGRSSPKLVGGPGQRRQPCVCEQAPTDEEVDGAIAVLKSSTEDEVVKEKMRMTFSYRHAMVTDPQKSCDVFSFFPRFLDTPGLIEQDFRFLFGEATAKKFLERWPTNFKRKVIKECHGLRLVPELLELLHTVESAAETENGWDGEMAAIMLLLHLLPPIPQGRKKPGRISASRALNHLVRFQKIGTTPEPISPSSQPHLLAVGTSRRNIQSFSVVIDDRVIPCKATSSVGAFDELFKAHFVFGRPYACHLSKMFTFVQTTIYNIDVGGTRESPRTAELRARMMRE